MATTRVEIRFDGRTTSQQNIGVNGIVSSRCAFDSIASSRVGNIKTALSSGRPRVPRARPRTQESNAFTLRNSARIGVDKSNAQRPKIVQQSPRNDNPSFDSARHFQSKSLKFSEAETSRPKTTQNKTMRRHPIASAEMTPVPAISGRLRPFDGEFCDESDCGSEGSQESQTNRPMSTHGTRRFSLALVEERESHRRALDEAWRRKQILHDRYLKTKDQLQQTSDYARDLQAELDELRQELHMPSTNNHESEATIAKLESESRYSLQDRQAKEYLDSIIYPFLKKLPMVLKPQKVKRRKMTRNPLRVPKAPSASKFREEQPPTPVIAPRIRDSDVLRALRRAEKRVYLLEQHLSRVEQRQPRAQTQQQRHILSQLEWQHRMIDEQVYLTGSDGYSQFSGDISVFDDDSLASFKPFLQPSVNTV